MTSLRVNAVSLKCTGSAGIMSVVSQRGMSQSYLRMICHRQDAVAECLLKLVTWLSSFE